MALLIKNYWNITPYWSLQPCIGLGVGLTVTAVMIKALASLSPVDYFVYRAVFLLVFLIFFFFDRGISFQIELSPLILMWDLCT